MSIAVERAVRQFFVADVVVHVICETDSSSRRISSLLKKRLLEEWQKKRAGPAGTIERSSAAMSNNLAKRMVNVYSKANDQLKRIAVDEGITLPAKLSAKDQGTKDRLSEAVRGCVRQSEHAQHGGKS